MLLTELYTVFLMALLAVVFTHPGLSTHRKAVVGIPILFVAYLIRPVVSGLLIFTVGYYLVQIFRKKWPWKPLLRQFAVFALILAVNTCVNHRETGYWVMLENYGAIPAYQANNSDTETYEYSSNLVDEFSDDYFMEVYFDESLDTQQKNELLSEKTAQFILENPGFCLRNAAIRYVRLFLWDWNWNLWAMLAALAFLTWKKRLSPGQTAFLLGTFAVVTAVPAFGLYIRRYSVSALPFYVLLNGTLYYSAGLALAERICLPPAQETALPGKGGEAE